MLKNTQHLKLKKTSKLMCRYEQIKITYLIARRFLQSYVAGTRQHGLKTFSVSVL